MNLDEFMQNADEFATYYIGSCSGYFFIGTKADYFRDIENINKKYYKSFCQMLTKSEYKLEHLQEPKEPLQYWLSNEEYEILKRRYEKALEKFEQTKAYLKERISFFDKYIMNFTLINEREVIDTYNKSTTDGIAVIIDGKEIGRYWFRHEYSSGNIEISVFEEDEEDAD